MRLEHLSKRSGGVARGTRNTIKSVYPLRNLAAGLEFFADPFDQYQAVRKIELGRERLIATFHTHPEGGAQLSEADRRYVFAVAPVAIVIGLSAVGHRAQVAAFGQVKGGQDRPAGIVVRH